MIDIEYKHDEENTFAACGVPKELFMNFRRDVGTISDALEEKLQRRPYRSEVIEQYVKKGETDREQIHRFAIALIFLTAR